MIPAGKKSVEEESRPSLTVVSAMVALNKPLLPGGSDFESLLKSYPEASKFKDFRKEENSLIFGDDQATVGISLGSSPIAWDHLEIPCKTSWQWPEAEQSLRTHNSFLLVNLAGDGLKKPMAMLKLTCVIAAICSLPECAGIYWSTANLVLPSAYFITHSRKMSQENFPLYLWVNFRGQKNQDGTSSLATLGMESLGFMEIEILHSVRPNSEVFDRAFNVAHYLLDNGPILEDGDTIGFSADEQILISHRPSKLNNGRIVYQLTI